MGLISCSVFKDKILDGTKFHTIRARKVPPKIGENLYLWWKSRTQERDFLGVSPCMRVDSIQILPHKYLVIVNNRSLDRLEIEQLAKNDGFQRIANFWDFFRNPISGHLIHWNPSFINRTKLRPEVVKHAQLSSDIIKQPSKIYSPSNGTEGMDFCSHWCDECDRDKDKSKGCHTLMKALVDKTPHWIVHARQPVCTSFVPLKVASKSTIESAQRRSLERKGQLNLLE